MNDKPRKPLRRTAWTLLLFGLVGTVLQLGAGVLVVGWAGDPAGPGQEATWPAGQTMTLNRQPGRLNTDPQRTAHCLLTPDGERPEKVGIPVGTETEPLAPGAAKITCDQPLALLTGTPMTIVHYLRGPLICVPLLAFFLGILFFFPRFTYFWARRGRPLTR